jgi:hypothetical protein
MNTHINKYIKVEQLSCARHRRPGTLPCAAGGARGGSSHLGLKEERKQTKTGFIVFVSACLAEIENINKTPENEYKNGNHQRRIRSRYVTDML